MSSRDLLQTMQLSFGPYRGMSLPNLREVGAPEADILVALKDHLRQRVDLDAEALRATVTTPGSGQAMEYQEAQAQAAAALKAPTSATPAKYPMLAATIGIDLDPDTNAPAADVLGVARSVVAAAEAWRVLGAFVRRTRLQAKAAIDAAADMDDACTAFDAVSWAPPSTS